MLEILGLIFLGFAVGLGGAIIPGPLLAFVIFDSTRKRRATGHFVIIGHALWEALVICLILFGLSNIMTQYAVIIYVAGGIVLILMGVLMIKNRGGEVKVKSSKVNSSILGGIFYTAFNPTQPPWWATAGLALLLQGYEVMGTLGILIVTAGHWLSDLTYYAIISYAIYKYGKHIDPWQRQITIVLGLFLSALGIYFLFLGTTK
jgi:threonine/homoserine/homoserine lactone efflux protein